MLRNVMKRLPFRHLLQDLLFVNFVIEDSFGNGLLVAMLAMLKNPLVLPTYPVAGSSRPASQATKQASLLPTRRSLLQDLHFVIAMLQHVASWLSVRLLWTSG
jgi:hypothetical protein